nr:unnamed protein product [Callosobruchus analis]
MLTDSMNSKRGLNDSDFSRKISKLRLHYRSLKSVVDCFNHFFGLTIFLELASIIVMTLAWLTQVYVEIPEEDDSLFVDPNMQGLRTRVFSSRVISHQEKYYTELVQYHQYFNDSFEEAEKSVYIGLALSERLTWKFQKRMAVYSLIQTCKDYAPEFSVLGLFHIKRSTILSLFNIISTLMIVVVQSAKNN